MRFDVQITPQASRQIRSLSPDLLMRVDKAILNLATDPRPRGCLKLQATENAWRIRVGSYRVIYEIHDAVLIVIVIHVDHRSDVYRK